MKFKRTHSLSNSLVLASVSLTFLGQKVVLLIMAFLGILSMNRYATVSIRVAVGLSLLLMFLIQSKKRIFSKEILVFVWFCTSMGFSIFFDILNGSYNKYYLSNLEVVGYFILFSIIPFFVLINSKYTLDTFDRLIKHFMYLGFSFSILVIYVYHKYISSVGRLSSHSVGDDNVVSPLILSYASAIIIVLGITYLLFHRVSITYKLFILITIGISTLPFFMGSSRGSLVAMAVSLLSIVLFRNGGAKKIKMVAGLAIMVAFGVYVMNSIQSNLLERIETLQDIDEEDARFLRYIESYEMFIDNPIFGKGLVLKSFENYPHNIVVEVIQASGIVGFTPFLILILFGIKSVKNVFKYNPKYAWVAVLYIQCLMGGMFSGSVITASWFWFSLALVIVFDKQFNRPKRS